MKNIVKTIRKGVEERNAYCRQCDWSDHELTANSKARYHCRKTGHTVDVYTEQWSKVKSL